MMDFYRDAANWVTFNWECCRVFYIMFGVSAACGGMIIWEFIRTIIEKEH